jgi:arylsulfatase A-like enzyme
MPSTDTTRRTFLAAATLAAAPARKRPNILLALADDWMWPHASIAGDAVVKTPTFDRLARRGVLFENAYVSAPSCTPSRAAILTGQYHWRLEEGANLGGTLPAKFPVYPDLLEAAGYHAGFTRKGWSPGVAAPGGRKRNPAGNAYEDFEAFLAQRPAGAPFCFWFGSTDPHRPYQWESGLRDGIDPAKVTVPPYLPDTPTVRKDICDYYWKVQRYDREVGALLDRLEKKGELDNTLVVMTGDNGWPFPRSKATVYETGTHVPLAIAWPGRAQGGRRVSDFVSMSDLAPTFLEAAGLKPPEQMTARSLAPLLASGKSGRVEPRRNHVLTGMERHVPCRGEIRGGYPTRALRTCDFHYIRNFQPDRWPSGDPAPPDTAFAELAKTTFVGFADIDAGPSKAELVTRRDEPAVRPLFDLACAKRPAQELYDLRSDPYALKNIAAEPRYAATLRELDTQLMSELKATGDPRATGGGAEFDQYVWYQGQGQGQKKKR